MTTPNTNIPAPAPAPATSGKGKVTVTAIPPVASIDRNSVQLSFAPVPYDRGGTNDKGEFLAGYLGIAPSLAATDATILESLKSFFATEKQSKDEAMKTIAFNSAVISFFNSEFARPAWIEASKGLESGKPIAPEIIPSIIQKFRTELDNLIESIRGERAKSSVQIKKLQTEQAEQLKALLPQLKPILELLKLANWQAFNSAPDNQLDIFQLKLRQTIRDIQTTQNALKVELKQAEEREAAVLAKLNSTEQEFKDLGLL